MTGLGGSVFNLVGDGGYRAFHHAWLFVKASNLVEIVLVVAIFVVGMFVHLPSREVTPGTFAADGSVPPDSSDALAVGAGPDGTPEGGTAGQASGAP
jgi:hypothetical protein